MPEGTPKGPVVLPMMLAPQGLSDLEIFVGRKVFGVQHEKLRSLGPGQCVDYRDFLLAKDADICRKRQGRQSGLKESGARMAAANRYE